MSTDTIRAMRERVLRIGYSSTLQLLQKATRDTDPVSVFVDGVTWDDAESAIFIVKGKEQAQAVSEMLARQGLVTPGKPVVT